MPRTFGLAIRVGGIDVPGGTPPELQVHVHDATTFMLTRPARLLILASAVWYFSEGLLGPLFAVFSERVGGDLLDITGAWAAYLIVSGLAYPIVGRLVNRSRWKYRIIVVGYALNTAFTFAYLLVDSTQTLLLVQVGLGIAEAVSTPSWDALFARLLPERDDTFLWGIASGHTQVVSGVAVAIGGAIATYVSFDALFLTMGTMSLVATLIQARVSWRTVPETEAAVG